MAAGSEDGQVLRQWLTMLGWQLELERDGEMHVGVARHVTADGRRMVVGACAPSPAETVWQLFESAIKRLGSDSRGGSQSGIATAA